MAAMLFDVFRCKRSRYMLLAMLNIKKSRLIFYFYTSIWFCQYSYMVLRLAAPPGSATIGDIQWHLTKIQDNTYYKWLQKWKLRYKMRHRENTVIFFLFTQKSRVSKVISFNAYWKLYLKKLFSTYWKQVENSWKKIYGPAKKNNSFVSVQHSHHPWKVKYCII